MKKILAILLAAALLLSFAACAKKEQPTSQVQTEAQSTAKSNQTTQEKQKTAQRSNHINIIVNGKAFSVTLADNDTARAFAQMLPLTLEMSELHGNEKYCYLDTSLPNIPQSVGTIHKGDVMLYGENCIVVFYKTFDTEYDYTKIGHIDDPESLENQLGKGKIEISFER